MCRPVFLLATLPVPLTAPQVFYKKLLYGPESVGLRDLAEAFPTLGRSLKAGLASPRPRCHGLRRLTPAPPAGGALAALPIFRLTNPLLLLPHCSPAPGPLPASPPRSRC